MATAADIIYGMAVEARNAAESAGLQATSYANDLARDFEVYFGARDLPVPEVADLIPPPRPIDDTAAIKAEFENAFGMYDAEIRDLLDSFFSEYFPTINQCIVTGTDDFICTTLANDGRAIPDDVITAMWQKDRDKQMDEISRLKDEALTSFAAAGHSLPTGVLYNRLESINLEASNRISESSREITLKDWDTRLDMLKFAFEGGVKLRVAIINAIGEFVRAVVVIPNAAAEYAKALTSMKTALISAGVDYYRAEIAEEDLKLRAVLGTYDVNERNAASTRSATVGSITNRAHAMAAAAGAMGELAKGAYSSVNTMVQLASTSKV